MLFRVMAFASRLFWKRFNLAMSVKNISTTSSRLDKLLEELKSNPYYDKYADKISKMQEVSPGELAEKISDIVEKKNRKKPEVELKERPFSSLTGKRKPELKGAVLESKKLLSDVMKTDLITEMTPKEIESLWIDYHKTKDVIAGVVPGETYEVMSQRGKEFSTFLLPIPRSQGYEFIMCQFSGDEVHFTPLIAYQAHKENAPECLTMTFYTDLKSEKNIVLMKGEYDSNILNIQEAQCLANELQLYYSQNNKGRLNLLEKFTYSPSQFDHMDLITELQKLSI